MPMLTIGEARAGEAEDASLVHASDELAHLASCARTSGMTSCPSACIGRSERLRNAMCMAARLRCC